jgi:Cu-Zn family superoxide dismutase
MAKAVCVLSSTDGSVSGELVLTQASEDAPTMILGAVNGLSEGPHGIAVHVYGDVSHGGESCGSSCFPPRYSLSVSVSLSLDFHARGAAGGRFNPFGKPHGGPTDEERQVGDLGNIEAGADGTAKVAMEDTHVKLIGPLSVIGRSFVVYAQEDDLGKVRRMRSRLSVSLSLSLSLCLADSPRVWCRAVTRRR